jgi:hypothetical protein
MDPLFSTHTTDLLFGALATRRHAVSPERRRAAMHAALRAYAGRLRRRYGAPGSRAR